MNVGRMNIDWEAGKATRYPEDEVDEDDDLAQFDEEDEE